jgi:transposase
VPIALIRPLGFFVERLPMKIVALDLGKFKTVACIYVEGKAEFTTLNTYRQKFTELFKQHAADMIVFETCTAAGWLSDLCEELDQPFFVANPNGEAWRWSTVKRRTVKDDALKLAKLTAMNQLPTVHVPSRATRAKRSLLKFRKSIVTARVKLQNEIRALWQAQGLAPLPAGKCGWTNECLANASIWIFPSSLIESNTIF